MNAIQNMEGLQNMNIQGMHIQNISNNNSNLQTNSVSKEQTFQPNNNDFKRKESCNN